MKYYFTIDFEGEEEIPMAQGVIEETVAHVMAIKPFVHGEVFIRVIDGDGKIHRKDLPELVHVN